MTDKHRWYQYEGHLCAIDIPDNQEDDDLKKLSETAQSQGRCVLEWFRVFTVCRFSVPWTLQSL